MNSIARMLALKSPDFVALGVQDKMALTSCLLLYLFKGVSASELGTLLKDKLSLSGTECIEFRSILKDNGYCQQNLKFYAYAKASGYKVTADEYEVTEADARWITSVLKSNNEYTTHFKKMVKHFHRNGYKPKSIHTFRAVLNKVSGSRELRDFCGKFVNKKHRFLWQAGQLDFDEIVQDLMLFGVYSVYRAYPVVESVSHMTNIMHTGIRNRGMNIIHEQTTQSRSRIQRNEDGTFRGTLLSLQAGITNEHLYGTEAELNQGQLVCNGLMSGLDGNSAHQEMVTDINRRTDLRNAVERILDGFNKRGPKTFIQLLMGVHHTGFSAYIGKPNDEWFDAVPSSEYADAARSYLGVSRETALRLVNRLRTELQDYRN